MVKPNKRRVTHYRSVFISDLHMGARRFDDRALVSFLKAVECQYLFLVGDIIDGWKLKKRWHWTDGCQEVFDHIFAKAEAGTKIIYLPGNHDDEVRHIMPLLRARFSTLLGFHIRDRMVHTLADGRKFVVLHGDQFDRKILRGALSRLSDRLYEQIQDFIAGYRGPTILLGGKRKPFSLAKYLAMQGKAALHALNNFESAVYSYTLEQKADGLICGHTHIPAMRNLRGILYANCGSWVGGGAHTALVETNKGVLHLIDWPASEGFTPELPNIAEAVAVNAAQKFKAHHHKTEKLVKEIKKLWPSRI